MQKKAAVVTSDKTEIGSVEYEVFDNVAEAVQFLGEEKALELINVQHKTTLMNRARTAATKPSKSTFEAQAFALITPEEFATCQGDAVKLKALLKGHADKLESEWTVAKAKKDSTPESTPSETETPAVA